MTLTWEENLRVGDRIVYLNAGRVLADEIRMIESDHRFREGIIEKCYFVTHKGGYGRLPVRFNQIIALDKNREKV